MQDTLQRLATEAGYEPGRGCTGASSVEYRGRGVWEVPFQRIPGHRCFVALNADSVEVAEHHMAPGGDESRVRRELAERLVRWESGRGFLRAVG